MKTLLLPHYHDFSSQHGGGMLTIVAVLGVLLALVQGSVYYKSQGSTKFLGQEKTKVLAQQLAEAGIEANIGDLGRRKTRVRAGLVDTPTYDGRSLGGGTFSSTLTTVAIGASADTVDLVSTGLVGKGSHTVHARMKLRKAMDTAKTYFTTVVSLPTSVTNLVPTDSIIPPANPASLPLIASTPEYSACMALPGAANLPCQFCHVPGGVAASAMVMNLRRDWIGPVHGGHIGDYVAPNCDRYREDTVSVLTPVTTVTMVDTNVPDSSVSIDTVVKVHILSWK
jgi:hypothetical protein